MATYKNYPFRVCFFELNFDSQVFFSAYYFGHKYVRIDFIHKMRNRMKDVSIFAGKYSALDKKLFSELISRFCLSFLLFIPLLAFSQNFEVENDIISISGLTNTTISIKGRSELRITGIGDPIPGCVINL
ncbi:MAG: hypothetical protein ACPMAG_05165, partial [Limisphaerales bacterium]